MGIEVLHYLPSLVWIFYPWCFPSSRIFLGHLSIFVKCFVQDLRTRGTRISGLAAKSTGIILYLCQLIFNFILTLDIMKNLAIIAFLKLSQQLMNRIKKKTLIDQWPYRWWWYLNPTITVSESTEIKTSISKAGSTPRSIRSVGLCTFSSSRTNLSLWFNGPDFLYMSKRRYIFLGSALC